MILLINRIRIKGGDTHIEHYLIYNQLSGVKGCSRERLKNFTHCVLKEISYGN